MNPAALVVLVALGWWLLTQTSAQRPRRNPRRARRRLHNPRLLNLSAADGKYRTILLDPPWPDRGNRRNASGGLLPEGVRHSQKASPGYVAMPRDRMAELPVGELAARNAHLYLWSTNSNMDHAYDLARRWGFTPTTLVTWGKPGPGLGLGFRNNTEQLIVARRGNLPFRNVARGTLYLAPRPGRVHTPVQAGGIRHNKPELFRELIERMSPGPRLELFARQGRPGWDVWGNQARAARERNPRRRPRPGPARNPYMCCRCGSGYPCLDNPQGYQPSCRVGTGHVFDFRTGGRCQCCGRMAPKRLVTVEWDRGGETNYGRTCAARAIGTTKLRTNQLEHMERQEAEREQRARHYRGVARGRMGESGIERPPYAWARGLSLSALAKIARDAGVSPYTYGWWDSANLVPGGREMQMRQGVGVSVRRRRSGEYVGAVLEGGHRGDVRRSSRTTAAPARAPRGRARGYTPPEALPF